MQGGAALIVVLTVDLFKAVVFPFVRYMAPAIALSFVFAGLPLIEFARREFRLKLSILIPVFDEEAGTIATLLDRVLATEVGADKEIVVVDDASTDGSWPSSRRTAIGSCSSAMKPTRGQGRRHPDRPLARDRRLCDSPGRRPRVRPRQHRPAPLPTAREGGLRIVYGSRRLQPQQPPLLRSRCSWGNPRQSGGELDLPPSPDRRANLLRADRPPPDRIDEPRVRAIRVLRRGDGKGSPPGRARGQCRSPITRAP